MLISKNKPSKKKKSNKTSQEFLKQSEKAFQEFLLKKSHEAEEALFIWQQTQFNKLNEIPFFKLQRAFKKLDEFQKESVLLCYIFLSEYPQLPQHPKTLEEWMRRESQLLSDFVAFLSDAKRYLDLKDLLIVPSFLLSDRFDHFLTLFKAHVDSISPYDLSPKYKKSGGSIQILKEQAKQLRKNILDVRKEMELIQIGRPKKTKPDRAELNRQWETFRDKGMKALKPRYRGYYEDRCDKRLVDLKKFLDAVSADFPHKIDEGSLDKLNHHFYKREPLLKAIYGYLIGIVKDSKTKIKPDSILKGVDRLIKSKNHELGQY